jgi:hypothetical protein
MISEIYTKDPADPNYQSNLIEHSDVYEALLSKIRMILYTKPGEVLGDPSFGVNLEEFVFSMNASNKSIENRIKEQIQVYIPEAMSVPIDIVVSFVKGDVYDICYIDILISGSKAMGLLIK